MHARLRVEIGHRIAARASQQGVGPGAAGEHVVAGAALQPVGARSADDQAGGITGDDGVGAGASNQGGVAGDLGEGIGDRNRRRRHSGRDHQARRDLHRIQASIGGPLHVDGQVGVGELGRRNALQHRQGLEVVAAAVHVHRHHGVGARPDELGIAAGDRIAGPAIVLGHDRKIDHVAAHADLEVGDDVPTLAGVEIGEAV